MYADRVVGGSKRSVKDRLDIDDNHLRPTRHHHSNANANANANKRQRQGDDKWEHDLYADAEEPQASNPKVGIKDLRLKLQKKSRGRLYQDVKSISTRGSQDLREKLSGSMHAQPLNNDLPQPKEVVEVPKPAKKSSPVQVPTPETKKPTNPASRKKSQQKAAAEASVDSLLESLGLEKYSITFQAEEIDMTALMHMNDEDLKALGIPMGPRKKIILALDSRA